MTTESPRFEIVQHKKALTPTISSPPLNVVTKRRKKRLQPELTVIIDLTKSPYTPEKPGRGDSNYDLFAQQLESSYYVHSRRLRPDWLSPQAKEKFKILDKIYSVDAERYLHPRSLLNIQTLSPKGSPKTSKAKSFSPFTPENQVKLRPLRGYRLQDVLRVQPITPVNYYKNTTRREKL